MKNKNEALKYMEDFNLSYYQVLICKNIKRIRKELHDNFKYNNPDSKNNPYTTLNISEIIGISHEYYKRLESYDKSKPISMKLFLKIYYLFGYDISEYFK